MRPKNYWCVSDLLQLDNSFERKSTVRVTGVLRPYDREKLECLYGPLDVESRDGHSFTRNPVLIIGYKPPVKQRTAVIIVVPLPSPAPEARAAPAPRPTEEVAELAVIEQPAAPEPPKALPRTASDLPFAAFAGFGFLFLAGSIRLVGRLAARGK